MNCAPKVRLGYALVSTHEEGSFAPLRMTTKLRSRFNASGIEKRVTELFASAIRITERMRVQPCASFASLRVAPGRARCFKARGER